ncbi:mechanosensitive ion channel family protein [Rossellomorea marisflavi]|uniref:mechanosensitive ion channel family protein n=1 Tax=Rossellomorea TaxID=2837508 RepID=UPI00064E4487|nr:mechanosensitive ion channel family protein [Rossellomorea marisflavi]KML06285.1 mechanosensitive ion channel protein [Rossellomorea marisflavi]KML32672.1 mechanosensitive ion channel protein [Rossellomorea marisflavi]MCM2603652.1 mechanosensitive ion channel family protein [Rossellomorea marisflavi]QHA35990.1 mechanosensitive ion channel [Rossellomorea marisflavi]
MLYLNYIVGTSTSVENLLAFDWGNLLINIGIGALKIIAIWIAFLVIKGAANKIVTRAFERYSQRNDVSTGRAQTLQALTKNIIGYVLIFIFFVTILQIFGIQVTAILAGAGIVGLAVGFGAQGLVSDIVTGFFILLEKQVDVGDYVTTGGFDGIVEEVGLRTTHIRGFDGTLHYVPNREISSVSNHSRGNMRALVDIGISYDDNIDEAIVVMQEVCDRLAAEDENIVEGPNVVGVQNLGDSDVVIRVLCKTKNMEQWGVERKIRKGIKEAFDRHGIDIPFPHQVFIEKKEQ